MKKIAYLLVLLAMVLVLPLSVFAEEETTTTTSDENSKVKVYFFRGEGCPHCQEAQEWFDSIQEEYGAKFEIIDYETWYNEDNAEIMKKVAEARDETDRATGVPYIVIGDKSWVGFDEEVYGPEIKAQIDSMYDKPVKDRVDIMNTLNGDTKKKTDNSSDIVAVILILLVVAGGCFGIYKLRQNTN